MSFPKRTFKIQLRIMALAFHFLHFTVHAQPGHSAKKTDHYFLDNFKCTVDINGSLDILESIGGDYFYFPLSVGLGLGYCLLKHKYQQLGMVKDGSWYDQVIVNAGNARIFIETGIKYPDKHVFKHASWSSEKFRIEEKFLVIPLAIQYTMPDFFRGGIYSTLFLGYNFKYLLSSNYTVKEATGLDASFSQNIPDFKKHFKKQNTSYHSITLGGGLLHPFGMYLDVALDVPLQSASASVDVNKPEGEILNETYINNLRSRYINVVFRLGIDILMLIKKYKDVSPPASERVS